MTELELRTVNHYPAYLMFSPTLFRMGVLYERLTSLPVLASFRGLILSVFQKPGQSATSGAQPLVSNTQAIAVQR
jgi:hypothetical protein